MDFPYLASIAGGSPTFPVARAPARRRAEPWHHRAVGRRVRDPAAGSSTFLPVSDAADSGGQQARQPARLRGPRTQGGRLGRPAPARPAGRPFRRRGDRCRGPSASGRARWDAAARRHFRRPQRGAPGVRDRPRAPRLHVGDVLYGMPWHVCPTVALHAEAVIVRDGRAVDRWPIRARARRLTV